MAKHTTVHSEMTTSEMLCDVAIIGYGPTGQMLALLLGEKGYRVAVFERWPNLYPKPRAIVYDHEIARIFQRVGIAQELAPVVEPGGVYEWQNATGEKLLSFDLPEQSVSGWPTSTMFSQPQLEAILDGKVKALPTVSVSQGWAAEQVAQTQDAVHLQVRKQAVTSSGKLVPGQEQLTVRCRYVIGADGAKSFLLQHMRTSLTDLGFLFDWLVVDIIPHELRAWDPLNLQICDPARPATVVSGGKGRRRWEFMRLPGLLPPSSLPGPGLFLEGDPLAGQPFLQREVARFGKRGLLDDLVGRGFCLISMGGDPAAHLSPADEAFFTSIGGRLVALRSSADESADHLIDLSGAYADWFAANTCAVVLTRPDCAIYGTAPDLAGARPLVRSLREQMHPSVSRTKGATV